MRFFNDPSLVPFCSWRWCLFPCLFLSLMAFPSPFHQFSTKFNERHATEPFLMIIFPTAMVLGELVDKLLISLNICCPISALRKTHPSIDDGRTRWSSAYLVKEKTTIVKKIDYIRRKLYIFSGLGIYYDNYYYYYIILTMFLFNDKNNIK